MYLDFLDIKIKYVIANMYEVIGARFETLDWKLYTLIAAHTVNGNDILSYSLTTMMCFLTKEWYGFSAYTLTFS